MRRPELGCIAAEDARHAAEPKGGDVLANERTCFGAVIDKQCEGRATRQRFDAKRASPREQIEHACAGDRVVIGMHQNIEQRLAKPVGSWPNSRRPRADQSATAQSATDHAHQSMIPKSGHRFSEKIMVKNKTKLPTAIPFS